MPEPQTVESHGPCDGVKRDERTTTGDHAEQAFKHRARDAKGRRTCGKPSEARQREGCREASRPVGLLDPKASRAPSDLSGRAACRAEARKAKADRLVMRPAGADQRIRAMALARFLLSLP
jgi:hypothetical protein